MKLPHHLFPSLIVMLCGWVLPWQSSTAQILPDSTLPGNSLVTPNGQIWEITGGTQAGGNLFHSFEKFSILTGETAFFNHSLDIQNIFSRVTGGSASEIDGLIRANGTANLFLLNPNGIMFGPNGRLDIGGSFFASTVSNFKLADETELKIAPETAPILTVNVPIGLQNTSYSAGIVNTGQLAVKPAQNIGLLAGTIINTGQLWAPGGRVTIATVPNITESGDLSSSLFELPIFGEIETFGLNVTNTGAVTLGESGFFVETGDIAIAPGNQGVPSVQAGTATLLAAKNLSLIDAALYVTGDLNLLARDTVQVRDSIANPFYAQAGGNLHIQGNQGINLLVLNHPHTPFQSGAALHLVSDGTIFADAHFTSGGSFSILNLSGNPGNFVSLYDPIISSEEDVIIGNYTGPSLKIESMGSITAGNLVILEPDTTLQPSSDPDIPILRSSPALILRAGVDALQNPPTSIPSVVNSFPEAAIITSSTEVYANDFENSVGDEWSNRKTDITPLGDRRFLGQFGGIETVSLNLDNIPEHNQATVTFDLFVIRSWDGSKIDFGPDIWNLTIPNYITLVNTTFLNQEDAKNNTTFGQAYPNSLFEGNNPGYTGTQEINSLGYNFREHRNDALYSLIQIFPHSDSSLQLNFFSLLEEEIENESWGIDNVTVSVQEATTSSGNPLPSVVVDLPNFSTSGSRSPGSITVGNMITAGGPIVLSGTSDITVSGIVRSFGGNISFESRGDINTTAGNIDSRLDQKGGNIILKANGNIFTNQIESNGGTITLDSGGTIDTTAGRIQSRSSSNGGTITFNADGDIFAGSITSSGDQDAGDINLISHGKLFIDGAMTEEELTIRSDTFKSGTRGNINFTANSISVMNGAQVLTGTGLDGQQSRPEGEGGTVTITARDFVEVSGTSPDGLRFSFISTASGGNINPADLIINTQRLIVKDRGAIVTAAVGFGNGQGGDLIVNASESVELLGSSVPLLFPTGLSADTIGFSDEGDAGNLIVNTKRFIAHNGGAASASTAARSYNRQGGNLIINASEFVELSGSSVNGFASGLYAQTFGAGNGGNLIVNTPELIVRDGAVITVSSRNAGDSRLPFNLSVLEGLNIPGLDSMELLNSVLNVEATGDAGNIKIDANSIILGSQGSITGETKTGEGGNITVETDDLQLRNGSNISTTAGIAGAGGNGGNITIVMDILAALENSDIRANAFEGSGGNIQITTQGDFRSPDSEIDASSQFGIDGTVTFNIFGIDPTSGLLKLPQTPVDVTSLVDRRCTPSNPQQSSFINIGRGGQPATPRDPLSSNGGWVDPNFSEVSTTASVPTDKKPGFSSAILAESQERLTETRFLMPHNAIVEAQGWIFNEQGQIILVGQTDAATPDRFLPTPRCGE